MVINERCPKCKHIYDRLNIKTENLSPHEYKHKKYTITLGCSDCKIICQHELTDGDEVNFTSFLPVDKNGKKIWNEYLK